MHPVAEEGYMVVHEVKKCQERQYKEFVRLKKTNLPAAQKLAHGRLVAAGIITKDGALSSRYK